MPTFSRLYRYAVAFAFAALSTQAAFAFPDKPITLVAPYSPGGITDLLARKLASGMADELGQPVVVANKPGGGGSIGAGWVAQAAPDGYTILLGALGPLSINKLLNPAIPYNPEDFAPIVQIGTAPVILAVNPSQPIKNVEQYLAQARKNPAGFNVATSGAGTPGHLSGVLFGDATKLNSTFVHYKGAGPSLTDLIGGQVQATFENSAALLPHIAAKTIRPIAVFSPQRLPMLPDVPTLDELGIKGVDANGWYGLVAPKGTPVEVTEKLRLAAIKTLESQRESLGQLGIVVSTGTSASFGAFIRSELARWRPIIKRLNLSMG